jgi:hypothetical protein
MSECVLADRRIQNLDLLTWLTDSVFLLLLEEILYVKCLVGSTGRGVGS